MSRLAVAATAADLALLLGSTIRVSRLVTTDDLGLWYVRQPAYRWASAHHDDDSSWRARLYSGLDCPWCVGFWIGVANTAGWLIARRTPALADLWRFGAGVLALNYVAATLDGRLNPE